MKKIEQDIKDLQSEREVVDQLRASNPSHTPPHTNKELVEALIAYENKNNDMLLDPDHINSNLLESISERLKDSVETYRYYQEAGHEILFYLSDVKYIYKLRKISQKNNDKLDEKIKCTKYTEQNEYEGNIIKWAVDKFNYSEDDVKKLLDLGFYLPQPEKADDNSIIKNIRRYLKKVTDNLLDYRNSGNKDEIYKHIEKLGGINATLHLINQVNDDASKLTYINNLKIFLSDIDISDIKGLKIFQDLIEKIMLLKVMTIMALITLFPLLQR